VEASHSSHTGTTAPWTPNYVRALPAVLLACCNCCLARGDKLEGHWVTKGRHVKLLSLQYIDCHSHWGEVLIKSRPQLRGTTLNVNYRTLYALLDHLRNYDMPMILTRLADRLEP